jgi:hypothetical protein
MTVSDTQVNTILNAEAGIVEDQLKNVKNTITSQSRVMMLNDSYSKKMAMYTRLVLAIIFALAIAILLNILKTRFSIIPESVITIAYIILFSGCLIYGMFVLADINSREKTDFDQLDLEPPGAVKKAIHGVKQTRTSGEFDLLPGFCIGKDCCTIGSSFNSDTDKCTQCAAGKSSADGAETCTDCAAGKFSTAGSACTDCPMGQYSTASGSTSCLSCPAGKYSTVTGAINVSSCLSCPAGKYSATVGANAESSCLSCPVNTYSATVGASSLEMCTACPANTTSPIGSTLSTDCVSNQPT